MLRVFGEKFSPLEKKGAWRKDLSSLFLDLFMPTCGVWNCYSNLATTREAWLNTPRMVGQKHG